MSEVQADHHLKFVNNGAPRPTRSCIRTFPHHTHGVSKESPDLFQKKHTLLNPEGYSYRHEHAPEFEYHSQKPFHPHNKQEKKSNNPYRFHLKKGRMTEFLDKNAWMKTVYVMNGHERSERARSFCNQARSTRINGFKTKPKFYNPKSPQVTMNQTMYHTLEDIMSERVRIRTHRNAQAKRQTPVTQRTLSEIKMGLGVEGDTVKERMAQTTQEWWPGRLSGRRRENSCRAKVTEVEGLEEWQRQRHLGGHWIDSKQKYLNAMVDHAVTPQP